MNIVLGDFYTRLGAIALVIALGFLLGKRKLINEETNSQLVNLLLLVFMPAALFLAFPVEYSDEVLSMFLAGLLGGIVVILTLLVASRLIFNKWFYKGSLRYESQFAFIFNNATFLGYPIVLATFGEAGLTPYCGFIIAFNLALFSYGVWLFKRKFSWELARGTLTNPNIIAVLLGVLVFLSGLRLPEIVTSSVGLVAGATTVLSLICIGFMLSNADFKKMLRKWRLFLTAGLQLILGPALTFLVLSVLQFPKEVIMVCALIQALPTATSLGLFAEKYGGNKEEAAELVAVSTVMSGLTLPVMASLLVAMLR